MSVDFNASFSGSAETFGAKMTETPASMTASMKETGGGSASNYEALRNKPKINGHELIGDMTPAQLGITDDRHHTHKQAQAAKVWTVAHNLGKRPAVTVVDSAGTVVIGEVDYLDDNTVRLTFCAAFSGTAYFNSGGKPVKFLTSIDLSQNEIQNAIMQPLAAPPANPKIGQIYFNSIDLTLYLWTGEKWIPVPTKTSQLENDSGFITSGDIPEGAAASTTTPKMNGTAAVGTEMAFARGDHVHPKDTSKLNTDGDGWVLKGDFSKFFYTLLHSYCYETARRALKWLKDPELIDFAEWLLWLIIDSTPDPGIPIGNQSSQLLALLYLDAFDHWLRDDRGLVYGRYMDDFYIIHSDKLLLRQILKEIEAYIKPLGLRLNGKTQILPLKNGIDFLGFHTYLTQTGKVVRKVRAKSIDNMKRKIRKFRALVDSGKITLDSVVQSYASWTGHISHGNTYHLRQNMDAYFFSYFPELKPSPKGDTTHGPKTEQPRKQVEGQVRQPVRQPDRLDRGR